MKAISLWQPWASLVALGLKGIETRGRPTGYRGPLAIHAAKAWTRAQRAEAAAFVSLVQRELGRDVAAALADPPRGAFVALVYLRAVVEIDATWRATAAELAAAEGEAGAIMRVELASGFYRAGRYAWLLDRLVPLRAPIRARGRQWLWTPADQHAEALSLEAAAYERECADRCAVFAARSEARRRARCAAVHSLGGSHGS